MGRRKEIWTKGVVTGWFQIGSAVWTRLQVSEGWRPDRPMSSAWAVRPSHCALPGPRDVSNTPAMTWWEPATQQQQLSDRGAGTDSFPLNYNRGWLQIVFVRPPSEIIISESKFWLILRLIGPEMIQLDRKHREMSRFTNSLLYFDGDLNICSRYWLAFKRWISTNFSLIALSACSLAAVL